jgi:hypothetical membrane protein
MLIYPGGYSFLGNYFSELGLTVTNGQPSIADYYLFSVACTSAAVCIVLFMVSMRTVFVETRLLKYLGWIGTILGILAAPFLSSLALFAGDVFPYQHGWSTILFFVLYSMAIAVYSIAILFNKSYNRLYSLVGFIVAAICLLYIFWLGSAWMQKLAVYALVLWSSFQGYRLLQIFGQTK